MKIGFFTDGFLPQTNGVATSIVELVRELEKRGHEVFIVAPKYPGYRDSEFNVERLASVKIHSRPDIRMALHLPDQHLQKVMGMEFDIIHGHSGGPVTLIGWELAKAKKIPFVMTYHTLWNRYTHYFLKGKVVTPKMVERATKILGNQIDSLIAPTERVKKELRGYGVKKPIYTVPSGIDTEKFEHAKVGYLRKLIKVPRDPILLFVGRLGKEKSIDFLIKAFSKVLKEVPEAHFAIVGEGVERKKLENLAKRLKVIKNVHFVGDVESKNMPSVYRDSTAFVFSSTSETQGLVVPEALAAGTPAVVVDDPAYECVKNGENGFVSKRDLDDFSNQTIKLLKDPGLHKKMSANAILSSKEFDIRNTTGQMEDVYYKMLDENNKQSIERIMADNRRSESFFVFQISFWATIVLSRFYLFLFYRELSYPTLNLGGSGFTLPSVGAFFALLSVVLLLSKRRFELTSLVFFGIGAGLLGSELYSILLTPQTIYDYWNPLNLFPILAFGIAPLLFAKIKTKESPRFFINTRSAVHQNPENPKISVVIPAFNEEAFIETTLKSLINQTYKNFELIVVDNNSTDKTAEIAKSFGARVISEKQKGVSHARQAGFFAALGEIVASTDSDAVVPANWVEKVVHEFEKDEKLVAFGGLGCLYSGPVDARAAGRFLFPAFWVIDRFLSGGWNLNGFNLAVKKSAFEKINGFRTDLTMGEDIDLAKRLREVGKVNIDTNFMAYVSGRRYKDGLIPGVMAYAPAFISRVVFRREDVLFAFPSVRSEKHDKRFTFLPQLATLVFLACLFYLFNMW